MSPDDPRSALKALVAAQPGESLLALSRMLGRNDAYLQQFVERGSPRALAEHDRRRLARYFGVSEALLGGADENPPARIVRLDVEASAGPGFRNEGERVIGETALAPALLGEMGVRAAQPALMRATGWSMEPGIADGDELLVDTADRRAGRSPAVFVIRAEGAVMVKRVAREGDRLIVTSDHPDAPGVTGEVELIGRVVGLARALR